MTIAGWDKVICREVVTVGSPVEIVYAVLDEELVCGLFVTGELGEELICGKVLSGALVDCELVVSGALFDEVSGEVVSWTLVDELVCGLVVRITPDGEVLCGEVVSWTLVNELVCGLALTG